MFFSGTRVGRRWTSGRPPPGLFVSRNRKNPVFGTPASRTPCPSILHIGRTGNELESNGRARSQAPSERRQGLSMVCASCLKRLKSGSLYWSFRMSWTAGSRACLDGNCMEKHTVAPEESLKSREEVLPGGRDDMYGFLFGSIKPRPVGGVRVCWLRHPLQ